MRTVAISVLLAGVIAGCADEGPVIRVIIDTPLLIPEQVSSVGIEVIAASETGDLCRPYRVDVELEYRPLPVVFPILRGTDYTAWVTYRVNAELDELGHSEPMTVYRWQAEPLDWPASGSIEHCIDITLDCYLGDCPYDPGCSPCAESEQCADGECLGIPLSGIFEREEEWRDAPPCDRSASL